MNSPVAQLADAQHPWLGLASFTESNSAFFAGRGAEIDDLLRLVRRDSLTLLYGVSGLGKTSLLEAGLFPALRLENHLPVRWRLVYREDDAPLTAQVLGAISAAAVAAQVEFPVPRPDDTLWEYFHREGNHFWSPRNDLVTPFLVFDQFEEFFTLGRETPARAARADAFIRDLADLVENRPPAALREDPRRAREFSFKTVPLKVLLSMREDYLADLDRIRADFRALGQNHLRLLPMGEQQAREVIALGAPLLAPGVEERIVRFVANADGEVTVAPALLSLVLRELNERRLARGPEAKINPDALDIEQKKIVEGFYLRTIQDFPEGVRTFIEDELLTASGHRNSCALDDALTHPDVTLPALNALVDRRLLAYEDRHHTRRVELTHDVLIPVIKASRDTRLTREAQAKAERLRAEQAAQERKQKITMAVAIALAVTLIATLWGGYYAFIQEHRTYYRELEKKHGFPVGILKISERDARWLPVSYRFVQKGVMWKGWKIDWKPAFRVEAVNGLLELTTNHDIRTYLWKGDAESQGAQRDEQAEKGERLGLKTVCQWEFVATVNGDIIYERALNREGRMVSGIIYSPPGSDPAARSLRLARIVGPDGFPQLQRRSAAEYVLIEYDQDGWEERVTYSDGKNQPAVGPDGAFGQAMKHNPSGQLTRLLSLDKDKHPTIDDAGNCGWEAEYDKNGQCFEERNLGTDLRPMKLAKEGGWVTRKSEYDKFGRMRRSTFHGSEGEPVLHAEGYHGWEVQYDDRGNRTVETYLGLIGAPTLLTAGYASIHSTYDGRGRLCRSTFHGVRGEPVLHTEGYHGWEPQYDDRGNEIATTYLDSKGAPTLLAAGYASVRSTYDDRGKVTRQSYHGVNGERVSHKDGYHAWETQYDDRGNQTVVTYLGLDGKPLVLPDGYAVIKSEYDWDGNAKKSSYFDAKDKPVLHKDGYHAWEAQYDGRGNRNAQTYLGLDGKPTLLSDGYATIRWTYDARGKEKRASYHGVDGERGLSKDGYHSLERTYNERGNEIKGIYLGVDGEHVLHKDGYHGWEAQYDERGNEIETTYLGLDEKPTLLSSGYATIRWTYGARGMATQESYDGVDGKPVRHNDGYHSFKRTYNERGNEIKRIHLGVDGEPVPHKEGYHGWEAQYDERGNEIANTYLGLDEKPTLLSSGYATIRRTYDERGEVKRESYHGVDGEPVLCKDGYYGFDWTYDERGVGIAQTYFGLDGKPAVLSGGYAKMSRTYDASGKVTRESYHGVNGEPVLYTDGYHCWEAQYDERGNEIEKTYLGSDGKPVMVDGWAVVRTKYDSAGKAGRLTEQAYYDAQDRLVIGPDGFARQSIIFHPDGREEVIHCGTDGQPTFNPLVGYAIKKTDPRKYGDTIESYHGPDGALITGPEGYAEVRRRWGDHEELLEEEFFGPRGQRVIGPEGHHRMTYIAEYFDSENRVFGSPGSDASVPIIYIKQILGIQQPAARIGLHAGDCLWHYGDWSFPEFLRREREAGTEPGAIAAKIAEAFFAERDRNNNRSVPITILRGGRPVKLEMPPLPEKDFGMRLTERTVPESAYAAMKRSAELSDKSQPEPRVPTRKSR